MDSGSGRRGRQEARGKDSRVFKIPMDGGDETKAARPERAVVRRLKI
jgi:hypothetical protein